jgi:hypothetical protein
VGFKRRFKHGHFTEMDNSKTNEFWNGKDFKGSGRGLIDLISRYLLRGTGKKTRNPQ